MAVFHKGGTLYYVFTDHLGSTLAVVDTRGNVLGKQSNKPHGEPYNPSGTLALTGRERVRYNG